jgi:hypothetical protein
MKNQMWLLLILAAQANCQVLPCIGWVEIENVYQPSHDLLKPQEPTTLSDLRFATTFAYQCTITATGCPGTPFTYTEYRTAFVDGNTYPALAASTVVPASQSGTVMLDFTFPNLPLSSLTPGELIIMVWLSITAKGSIQG